MALKNQLGKIKDVAAGAAKVPVTAVGSAVGLAKGAAAAVGRSKDDRDDRDDKDDDPTRATPEDTTPQDTAAEPTEEPATATTDDSTGSRPEPVNVTEELGLDPAPVDKPKPSKEAATSKPTTAIDAAADPSKVDVTPADVAEAVAKDAGQESDD
ncbi:hypothetical protein [Nocardioides sp. TF02-7]|uniref:hypothetical protein n=1 Tax=Nocardioides sp. TF02-7 TaxID=2917724 RepID=UPI001F050C37|nr:hypothetical protein [Nocardioides sp. TF02-7]UMG92659.1 hypothetical protein MF408_23430 [Nocardioides sp. TF02-7]